MGGSGPQEHGSGTSVQVTITGGSGYANGDTYAFTITDASGMTSFAKNVIASYSDYMVCGDDCHDLMVDLYP